MQQNDIVIAGNLAADADLFKEVSPGKDLIVFSVYTERSIKDSQGNYLNDVHNVTSYGKSGIFDNFSKKLLKGTCVQVKGSTEEKKNEKDGNVYYNNTINASFPNGSVEIMKARVNKNRAEIMGFLAEDAIVRESKGGEFLTLVVLTSKRNKKDVNNPYITRHSVIKFSTEKGVLQKQAALLKKGAGITVDGPVEKYKQSKDGKNYYNTVLNATFSRIQVTKYVTEKPPAQQPPAQQAPAQQAPAQQAPAQQAPAQQAPAQQAPAQQAPAQQESSQMEQGREVPPEFDIELDKIFGGIPDFNEQ